MDTKKSSQDGKQKLREEGFKDCQRYFKSFESLRTIIKIMKNYYKNRRDYIKKLGALEGILVGAMGLLKNSKENINEIENKYQEYLGKSYRRPVPRQQYNNLLKDLAKTHKNLAEYVAYSKGEGGY